jgi:hypothetical protein
MGRSLSGPRRSGACCCQAPDFLILYQRFRWSTYESPIGIEPTVCAAGLMPDGDRPNFAGRHFWLFTGRVSGGGPGFAGGWRVEGRERL